MTTKTKSAGQIRVDEISKKIRDLVAEAEKICDETGASFRLNIAYGMGGNYIPSMEHVDSWTEAARGDHDIVKNDDGTWERDGYYDIDEDGGWYTSSMSC